MPATADAAIMEGESFKAHARVEVIATLRVEIEKHDERIAELMKTHEWSAYSWKVWRKNFGQARRIVNAFDVTAAHRHRSDAAEPLHFLGILETLAAGAESDYQARPAPQMSPSRPRFGNWLRPPKLPHGLAVFARRCALEEVRQVGIL